MNIYIDGKRVNSNGNIIGEKTGQYEYFNPLTTSQEEKDNPYAYILDRPGPDTIAGEVKLRIPSGRYDVEWHNGKNFKNVLKLHNDFISSNRAILICGGNTPKDSEGCLLINNQFSNNDDNVIERGSSTHKATSFAHHIKGNIAKGILNKTLNNNDEMQDFVQKNIEVRIQNSFKIPQISQKRESQSEIPNNVIRIETQDDSGEFIEIVLPDNDNGSTKYSYDNTNNNNDDELNTLLNEAKDILYEILPLSSLQSAYENLSANEYKEALGNAITILPQAKILKSEKIIAKAKTYILK